MKWLALQDWLLDMVQNLSTAYQLDEYSKLYNRPEHQYFICKIEKMVMLPRRFDVLTEINHMISLT